MVMDETPAFLFLPDEISTHELESWVDTTRQDMGGEWGVKTGLLREWRDRTASDLPLCQPFPRASAVGSALRREGWTQRGKGKERREKRKRITECACGEA